MDTSMLSKSIWQDGPGGASAGYFGRKAAQAEEEIQKLEAQDHGKVVLDAEKLEYISSAGLRVILRLRKQEPELAIVNASPGVYEIFEMTGFTEMMPVSRAYRRVSVDGCEVIGQGANGKVYRLDPETIIKVYLNPNSLPDIHRERELARKAFVLGIPTAIPYDVVKVGDGYGSVFELLNAKSFGSLIAEHPEEMDKYVKMYVDLLKKIHGTEVHPEDLRDMKESVVGWVEVLKGYLPDEQYGKLHRMVEEIPDDNHMIHGDYHVKNVMLQNGETILIDMDTIRRGNPVFEFASIYLAYVGFGELDDSNIEKFLGITYETAGQVWKRTLRYYFETEDEERLSALEDKARVLAYTKLMRRTIYWNKLSTEEDRRQMEYCREKLIELLGRVDSLLLQ